jgi:hypothetical protein
VKNLGIRARNLCWMLIAGLMFCIPLNESMAAELAPNATGQTSQPQANIKCENTTLTQGQFLDMLHAVVTHGDLIDVPFIEKTLQTKLELQADTGPIHDRNLDSRHYLSNFVLDSHIGISLAVSFNPAEYEKGKEPAHDREGSIDVWVLHKTISSFKDCRYLNNDQFKQVFGSDFVEHPAASNAPPSFQNIITACKILPPVDKYYPLQLLYRYEKDSGNVEDVFISQSKRYVNNQPTCG